MIGVASVMGYLPSPGYAMYGSSKIYMQFLFEAMSNEFALDKRFKNKIEGLCYSPAFVDTKINTVKHGLGIPLPLEAAEQALKDMGRI